MKFKDWKKDKLEEFVSAFDWAATKGSKYYDFLGKVSEIGPEMDNYEVSEPVYREVKTFPKGMKLPKELEEKKAFWLIELIPANFF